MRRKKLVPKMDFLGKNYIDNLSVSSKIQTSEDISNLFLT